MKRLKKKGMKWYISKKMNQNVRKGAEKSKMQDQVNTGVGKLR